MASKIDPYLAIFLPSLVGGGVQRAMLLLTEGLLQRQFRVDLVVGQAKGPFLSHVPAGARLVDLKARHLRGALPNLYHYLKDTSPTALLSAQTHANILALLARKVSWKNIRLVISEHNNMSAVMRDPGAGRERLLPLFARMFYPWADEVVAVSSGAADSLTEMIGLPRSSIHVIYNPLIPSDLESRIQAVCTHPWLVSGGKPVILAAGRLARQKDYPCLLRALAILRQQMDVRLLILGEGSERAKLENLVNELGLRGNVDMPGYIENIYSYMARVSTFVLSSAWEGFPSVLVEAMACGVSVVATDCPSGPSEILGGGQYGKLVPVGDSVALAEALRNALVSPGPIETARLRAKQFTIERAVQEYVPLLTGN
jgi:glycosyltransferase involved in cell wall biosynthesis